MPNAKQELVGVVLAGGQSKRLGEDKALLVLPGCSQNLLEHSAALLGTITSKVYISGRQVPGYASIPDRNLPPCGALRGLYSALSHVATNPCLFIACDMPFLNRELLLGLVRGHAQRQPGRLMTTWQGPQGRMEALCAIYEPECLALCEQALAKGQHQLNRLVPENLQERLLYGRDWEHYFLNINFPADRERAAALAAQSPGACTL